MLRAESRRVQGDYAGAVGDYAGNGGWYTDSATVSFTANGVYVRVPLEHFDDFGTLDTPAPELHDKLAKEIDVEPMEIFRSALESLTATETRDLMKILTKIARRVQAIVRRDVEKKE